MNPKSTVTVICVNSGETANILFSSVRLLCGFGTAIEDLREWRELAQKNIIAVDEKTSGTSEACSTRKAIVTQTWKAFPVNNDKVKFQCPDYTFTHVLLSTVLWINKLQDAAISYVLKALPNSTFNLIKKLARFVRCEIVLTCENWTLSREYLSHALCALLFLLRIICFVVGWYPLLETEKKLVGFIYVFCSSRWERN